MESSSRARRHDQALNRRQSERLTNEPLGRLFWTWVRDNTNGRKTDEDQPCRWGDIGAHIGEHRLAKTATQFEFDAAALPEMYAYIDQVARENPATP